jgi:hypothetical protein
MGNIFTKTYKEGKKLDLKLPENEACFLKYYPEIFELVK